MAVTQFLHGIEVVEVQDGARPIQTVRSSVIGLVGTAGKGPLNTPTLIIGSKRDAVAAFGAFKNDGFTIPGALDAIFQQAGALVVVVNVLDPTDDENQSAVTSETLILSGSVGTLLNGFLTPDVLTFATGVAPARTILNFVGQPTDGQTVVAADKTLTFRTALSTGPTVPNEVLIGTDLPTSIANYIAAFNGGAGIGTTYSTGTTASVTGSATAGPTSKVYFAAVTPGTGGNSLTSTTTVTGATFSTGATFAGGATNTKMTAPYVLTADGVITLPTGCSLIDVKDSNGDSISFGDLVLGTKVTVDYVGSIVENTDFTVDRENGVVTRIATGSKILPSSKIVVSYAKVDPTAITAEQIVGSVDGENNYTGAQCLLAARSTVFVEPRILIAPGFTHQKTDPVTRNVVGAGLEAISDRLRAVVVLDAPNSTPDAAAAYAADFGGARFFVHYPFYKVAVPNSNGTIITTPGSAFVAGRISATDNDPSKGFWWSPSNSGVNGIVGLGMPVDFAQSDPNCVANYLNELNVCVTIYQEGFVLWGNRACDGNFLCVRRTQDFVGDSITLSSRWASDRPITRGFVMSVVASVNEYLRRLTQAGAILGGKAWADPTINTDVVIASGELFIDFDMTPTYPAEHIVFRMHLVGDYVAAIFTT